MAGEAAPPFATDAGRPSPGPTAGAAEPPATAGDLPLIEEAALHLYRLYDLGYGIDSGAGARDAGRAERAHAPRPHSRCQHRHARAPAGGLPGREPGRPRGDVPARAY